MGTVAILFGIIIVIHPNDHNPPHVHVWCGEKRAKFSIVDGRLMNGHIPASKVKIVQEFISCYKKELLEMWKTKSYSLIEKK